MKIPLILSDILNLKIRGCDRIKRVAKEEKPCIIFQPNGSFENAKEWTINTDGSNLIEILSNDMIDITRTMSNDINEIYEIFGIEAVRTALINEFVKIIPSVNDRHWSILMDIMTYRGSLMSIDRHGINRSTDNSFISKATFEESTDILIKAAIFAETDKMKGVSANIMMGQLCHGGTNDFDLMFDEEKYITEMERRTPAAEVAAAEAAIAEEMSGPVTAEMIEEELKEYQGQATIQNDSLEFGYSLSNISEHKIHKVPELNKPKVKIIMKKKKFSGTPANINSLVIVEPPTKPTVSAAPEEVTEEITAAEQIVTVEVTKPKKKVVVKKK
jgi:DNA-directed RNA polymerase beta' subunit